MTTRKSTTPLAAEPPKRKRGPGRPTNEERGKPAAGVAITVRIAPQARNELKQMAQRRKTKYSTLGGTLLENAIEKARL